MSSVLTSQGVVVATAMAAVSGTVILLSLCRPKPMLKSPQTLRSCISSDEKKREKKKKRVQFAEDVIDPVGNGEEFRRQQRTKSLKLSNQMPANRLALYNGIRRDRVQRMTCSY
ncbi:hypothetical protein GIB67_017791 [Kingdonia uniflora]|uniref:Uncharacterized protein n=1 Tax=Kingdonia uniflora TaxID=39325 RepID=A0A7J7MNX9_9MAGN|nr:hypothetical protein GIB67_017791 [Kingdonia uniflora]